MLHRVLGSQAFMSIVGVAVIAALGFAGYFVVFDPLKKTEAYCAIMPDSIGLYVGNQVSMRGINVGQVTSVQNQGPVVRVDFAVDADHPVLADASATTVSNTVVADRDLAILASGDDTRRWDSSECITKTLTPKSLTETLTALAALSDELNGADPTQQDALSQGLAALDSATAGTGQQINDLVKKLGAVMESSDADIGHLAGIFDAFASVSVKVAEHWGDLESMLTRLSPILDQASTELLGPAVELFDGLRALLPVLNDITTMFGDPILRSLDDSVGLLNLLRANVGSLSEIVELTPALASAFTTVTDPATGAAAITYAPPRVAIPQQNSEQVCAALNAVSPGYCSGGANGMVDVALVPTVLGLVGAR